nr:NADH dehydrogenase [ubiquinone] iron-sulfur protein 5 [Pogona vitticeps]XP_020656285.1 NADH dehydrogenase [ubiquinone] iron-sulfur protein 5 [Pogona vitticeps]
MPFIDFQELLGIDLDRWYLQLTGKQPYKQAARCHAFEKEWLECAEGIGELRAKNECKTELEDLRECMTMQKMSERIRMIREQKRKLIKEGKYTPPEHHCDK